MTSGQAVQLMISEELNNPRANTLDSWTNLITLYEAWNKPEIVKEWLAKQPQSEALRE